MKNGREIEVKFITLKKLTIKKAHDHLQKKGDESILKNNWFSNYVQSLIEKDLK